MSEMIISIIPTAFSEVRGFRWRLFAELVVVLCGDNSQPRRSARDLSKTGSKVSGKKPESKFNDIKPWRQFSLPPLYAQNHHERSPIRTKGCHRIRAQA